MSSRFRVRRGRSSRSARVLAVAAFVTVTVAALVVLAVVGPGSGTGGVRFEIAKTALQVIGVAVVGGVVSLAAFALQRERIERYEAVERDRVERREDLRRDADRMLEDRRRDDEFLRRTIERIIEGYNDIKKVRRAAAAELRRRAGDVSGETYLECIVILTDRQLTFEALARLVPQMGGVDLRVRGARSPSEIHFRVVESYLNRILREHRDVFRGAEHEVIDTRTELPRFHAFLVDTTSFREHASGPVQRTLDVLQGQLRRPVALPHAEERDAGSCDGDGTASGDDEDPEAPD